MDTPTSKLIDLPIILASSSVYRRESIKRLRLDVESVSPDIDETPVPNERADELSQRLALAKARKVASQAPGRVIIGCDQVAVCEGRLLGKPGTIARAIAQLESTNGKVVVFHSALAVVHDEIELVDVVPTHVRMRQLDRDQIERYVELEKPIDCAGAMKSEALGICLTRSITSEDPSALIGLPLIRLVDMLTSLGFRLPPLAN